MKCPRKNLRCCLIDAIGLSQPGTDPDNPCQGCFVETTIGRVLLPERASSLAMRWAVIAGAVIMLFR